MECVKQFEIEYETAVITSIVTHSISLSEFLQLLSAILLLDFTYHTALVTGVNPITPTEYQDYGVHV